MKYKIGNFNELLFRSRLWKAGPSILLGQTWALNDSITIGPFSLHRPLSFYLLIAGSCKNGRRSILLRFPFRPPQLLNCSCVHSPGYSTVHVCIMQFSMCPNSSMLCKFIINFQIGAKQSPGQLSLTLLLLNQVYGGCMGYMLYGGASGIWFVHCAWWVSAYRLHPDWNVTTSAQYSVLTLNAIQYLNQ